MTIYLQALGLGIVAGMRSMTAPAAVSRHFSHAPACPLANTPLRALGTPTAASILTVLAVGELIGDKLPRTPNRIAPGPLGGRAASGGLCGGAVFLAAGKPAVWGAAIGVAAAIASTYATFYLRRRAGQISEIPDPVLAVVEDILALSLAKRLFAKPRMQSIG